MTNSVAIRPAGEMDHDAIRPCILETRAIERTMTDARARLAPAQDA
jgi:hypothetical protein